MKCAAEHCIYNKDCVCSADNPKINSLGMCDACVTVSFDKEFLEEEKKRRLMELGK